VLDATMIAVFLAAASLGWQMGFYAAREIESAKCGEVEP